MSAFNLRPDFGTPPWQASVGSQKSRLCYGVGSLLHYEVSLKGGLNVTGGKFVPGCAYGVGSRLHYEVSLKGGLNVTGGKFVPGCAGAYITRSRNETMPG